MVRTMGEGVRSSQGQVDDMRRRLERLEILLEASEASVPEMEAGAEQRPETTGPQVKDKLEDEKFTQCCLTFSGLAVCSLSRR